MQEVFLTPGYLAIATEYADGGSVTGLLQRPEYSQSGMPEADARPLFQQMAAAVDYCHRRGVTLGGFSLRAWLLDRAPGGRALRQQTSGKRPAATECFCSVL